MLRYFVSAAIALACGVASASDYPTEPVHNAFSAVPPVPGVYGCFGVNYAIVPPFGIVDDSHYVDSEGGGGTYSYDPSVGLLKMETGSFEGIAYWHEKEITWRPLRVGTNLLSNATCVHDPEKDINNPPW